MWDTALAAHALMEAGGEAAETAALDALAWLKPLQVLDVKGDWAEEKPDVRPGGWAFQYANAHYPDLDDTAVVVMAMDRARKRLGAEGYDEAIARGEEWTVGLQSKNGGLGAFDADNSLPLPQQHPLRRPRRPARPADGGRGRRACVSMLAQLGDADRPPAHAARRSAYLENDAGAGRQLVRPLGRELHLRHVVGAVRAERRGRRRRGARWCARRSTWLVAIQNADGGWGEDCDSYKLDYKGYEPAPSTASQTAWALLGLMAAGEATTRPWRAAIAWLQANQGEDGLWGAGALHRRRLPARLLPALPRLPEVLPAVGRWRATATSSAPTARTWRGGCERPRRLRA